MIPEHSPIAHRTLKADKKDKKKVDCDWKNNEDKCYVELAKSQGLGFPFNAYILRDAPKQGNKKMVYLEVKSYQEDGTFEYDESFPMEKDAMWA